jgi:serine phosphatase RsbU (regulator of sigma subunit)
MIDRTAATVTYSRAGHPPPLLAGPGGHGWLDGALSLPLAVKAGVPRTNETVVMGRDDVLVLYSDGLVERRNETIDDGLARLADTVLGAGEEPAAALADRLLRELLVDGSSDDVVVVVKRLHD